MSKPIVPAITILLFPLPHELQSDSSSAISQLQLEENWYSTQGGDDSGSVYGSIANAVQASIVYRALSQKLYRAHQLVYGLATLSCRSLRKVVVQLSS